MNLLMIAPLYDNKGAVRYFLGCQIDISSMIENGRGVESFAQLLAQDRTQSRFGGRTDKDPNSLLGDLKLLLNHEEMANIGQRARNQSVDMGRTTPQSPSRAGRRLLGMEEPERLWPSPSLGPSGRMPGVYQNYLLVRPYPSLRITFTSPALRIPGLLQTKFLDRVGGPQQVREGVLDSLAHGMSVTAKISWLTGAGGQNFNMPSEGKPRWIHCTPLLGSDDKVGVWMIVMVENEEITGTLNARSNLNEGPGSPMGAASARYTGHKLYTEYLRREGKEMISPPGSPRTAATDVSYPSRHSSVRSDRRAFRTDTKPQPFQGF